MSTSARHLTHALASFAVLGALSLLGGCGQRGATAPPGATTPMAVSPAADPEPSRLEVDAATAERRGDDKVAGELETLDPGAVSLGLLMAPAVGAATPSPLPSPTLVVALVARSGSLTTGTVSLRDTPRGVEIKLRVTDTTPPGPRGVHLHEAADCSAPDASSAGGHWNPGIRPHGLPGSPERHAGDLGNLIVEDDGTGELVVTLSGITLAPGDATLVGRALVVHARRDDGATQPSGDSGDRIGCAELR